MAMKVNFGVSVVSTAPTPATSGLTLSVNSGDGAVFPTTFPFYVTVWPADEIPTKDNAEVLQVTDVDGDDFTIVRAQKGTTAKTITSGMAIANAIYAEDVQGGPGYVYVATYDSTDEEKGRAQYICSPTAADVQIQAAIDSVIETGGVVYLASGTYECDDTLTIDGLLSSLPGPSENAKTIGLLGTGNQTTVLQFPEDTNGILLTGTPMVRIHDMQIQVLGTGSGIRSVITTGSYRGFWNSSFKNLSFIGDFDAHTGWAMDLDGPFRSTFENIEANGVGNGIKLSATDGAFNPGNCTFNRCFMDLGAAANGKAYYLYTPDDGGSFNICTFIQCEGIDGNATSTTSVGIHLRGSATSYFSSKNIRVIQSNLEEFNIAVKLEHAEDNYIEMSWSNTKDGGKLFEADATSSGNELYCLTSYVAPGDTMAYIDDNNTTTDRPNVVGHSTVYVDTGGTLTADPGTDTIIEQMRVWGPGTWDTELDGYWMPANQLGAVKITGTPTTGDVLKATSATAAEWDAESGGGGVDTANSPGANEIARFVDADTIEGRTAAEFKADLDLEVGTDLQAYDADLAAIAALTSAANKLPYATGAGTWALADFTAAGRALVDDADAAAQRTTLGVGTSDSPQFAGINVGAATDTTITRVSAGVIAVEGVNVALNGTTQTHTVQQLEVGAATDTTISRSSAGVIAVEGVVIPSISSTNTLTNKRITKRIASTASSGTPTPSADNDDQYQLTALAANATWGAPTGTPTSGQPLILRWKDNGTSRTLAWNAIYRGIAAALPTATTVNKTSYAGFIYNGADSKWDMVAFITEP